MSHSKGDSADRALGLDQPITRRDFVNAMAVGAGAALLSRSAPVPAELGRSSAASDPDRPAMITFYVPVTKPGLPVEQQGPAARAEVLATAYRDYEYRVRLQLTEMLSAQGFDARRDIAGIVLNRWGHAYVDPYPGFFFGKAGQSAPAEVVRQPLGRISFAHSELRGHQYWDGGVEEGRRAMEQALQHL